MPRQQKFNRLLLLLTCSGLVAGTANYACLPDVCADLKSASYTTWQDLQERRIATLNEVLVESGLALDRTQLVELKTRGHLLGVAKSNRPVKHPDGTIEIPDGLLQPLPEGHPWASSLSPADDAFYSFFEERIVRPGLFDPQNPQHVQWAEAYLKKAASNDSDFIGWTYANRTECAKIRYDAKGTTSPTDARF